jgi:hypothetical protein
MDEVSRIKAEDDGVRLIDFIGSPVIPEKVGFEALKAIKPEPEIG